MLETNPSLFHLVDDTNFAVIVLSKKSFAEILTEFKESPGVSIDLIIRRVFRLGLDCGHFWDRRYRSAGAMPDAEVFIRGSRISPACLRRRVISRMLIPYQCSKCGLGPGNSGDVAMWQGEVIVLQLDHINGCNKDNRLENLRFLCPNCHSQTATFTGRNLKRKRDSRGVRRSQINSRAFSEAVSASRSLREVKTRLGFVSSHDVRWIYEKAECEGVDLSHLFSTKMGSSKRGSSSSRHAKAVSTNCPSCGGLMFRSSQRCRKCSVRLRSQKAGSPGKSKGRKVSRPDLSTLMLDVENLGYEGSGAKYGVSGNAIKKWLRSYGVDVQTRSYKRWTVDNRPSLETLYELVQERGYKGVRNRWGIDHKTVKKWFQEAGLPLPKKILA